MLLVSGRVVYYGEAAVALRYFEALGQSPPKKRFLLLPLTLYTLMW